MNWRQTLSQVKAVMGIMHGSRAFGGPFHAELGLINQCNIRCLHCYYHSSYLEKPTLRQVRKARLMGNELPDDNEIKQIQRQKAETKKTNALIDKLMSMGTHRFQFSGNGEPFLHKNALDFMGRVKHANCKASILTAGHMLSKEKIDGLINMGFDEIRITPMAGTNEMYLRTHPGIKEDTFEKLRNNLWYLADRKKALGVKRPIVKLFYVVISENHDGLMEFAEFSSLVMADEVQFRPFDDVRDPGLSRLVPTKTQSVAVKEQLADVKAYLESKGVGHNISFFLRAFERQLDTSALYHLISCYYTWLAVRIEPDGELFPCCRSAVSLGNVYENDFEKIWYGAPYRELRRKAATINRRNTPVDGCTCHSCVNFTANLRIYKMFHLIKGRSARLKRLCPTFSEEGE